MKICVCTSTFPLHSEDTARAAFLAPVLEALRAAGHHVTVFTQSDQGAEVGNNFLGIPVVRFRWLESDGRVSDLLGRPLRNSLKILSLVFRGTLELRRLHRKESFDAILCCWAVPSGLYAWVNSLLGGMPPYSIWALGSDIGLLRKRLPGRILLRAILRGADLLFADGLDLAREVRGISTKPCEFLGTHRRLGSINRHLEDERPLGGARFLFVGRHAPVKGVDSLLGALPLLRKLNPDAEFELEIAGQGEQTDELKVWVSQAGLDSRVRFLGELGEASLAAAYCRCDCVVIPSRFESVPLVLGEAVGFGKAVIATDVGDMGVLVRRFRLGQVVAPADSVELASAMSSFLASLNSQGTGADFSGAQAYFENCSDPTRLVRAIEGAAT